MPLPDDLNRWLRGEPIAARPVGPATRLVMWAKRKPAMAGLSAALILVAIGGIVGIATQWREAVYQRDQARQSRDIAVREVTAAREAEGEAKTARDAAVVSEQTAVASEKAAKLSEQAAVVARAQADENAQLASREAAAARKAEGEAKSARDDAIASEKVAVAARAEAEKNAQIAGEQATRGGSNTDSGPDFSGHRRRMKEPGLFELKTAILEAALKRVDGVAGKYDKVETSHEATTAAAYMQFSHIYRQLGQTEKAFRCCKPTVP